MELVRQHRIPLTFARLGKTQKTRFILALSLLSTSIYIYIYTLGIYNQASRTFWKNGILRSKVVGESTKHPTTGPISGLNGVWIGTTRANLEQYW